MIGALRPSRHGTAAGNAATRALEHIGLGESGSQLTVVGTHRERDRERAVVTREHGELEVTELADQRTLHLGRLGPVDELVETRQINDAALEDVLGRRSDADVDEPVAPGRPRPARVHHEIGSEHAVALGSLDPNAAHVRRTTVGCRWRGQEAEHGDAIAQVDPRRCERLAPQYPFERRAAAGQRHQLVVAGPRVAVSERLRRVGAERDLGGALGE